MKKKRERQDYQRSWWEKNGQKYTRLGKRTDAWKERNRIRKRGGYDGMGYRVMVRSLLMQRDGVKCGICSNELTDSEDVQIDHVVPVYLGGGHEATNIRLSHSLCNNRRPKPRD